jgi:hypothetical protein
MISTIFSNISLFASLGNEFIRQMLVMVNGGTIFLVRKGLD